MIQVTDLRIGNWVADFGGNYVQIIRLAKDKQPLETPIPLTTEILEKCGLIAEDTGQIFTENNAYEINKRGDIYEFEIGGYSGRNEIVEIRYLHQLQNLYYALTGQELKVAF